MGTWKIWTSPLIWKPTANVRDSTPLWSTCLGLYPRKKKSGWKNHIRMLVHTYNCTQNSATGFSPYYLMYWRQPDLLVDVILGLALCTIMEPNTSKFVQKMMECTKWAQRKAEAFQAKEAQRHKWNYDERGRAAALEVGDTVLVHVAAFKDHHKIQDRWENMEYVVESGPILMFQSMWYAPGMGKGAAGPCIGTICFPSIPTWSRAKQINLWPELEIPLPNSSAICG